MITHNSRAKIVEGLEDIGTYQPKELKRSIKNRFKAVLLAIVGGVVGLVNGLLGGGGGSVVVPMLHSLGDLQERNAHASAILAILPISLVSGVIYAARGDFPVRSGLITMLGVVVGGLVGAMILKKINPRLLSIVFYGIMIYSGIRMII